MQVRPDRRPVRAGWWQISIAEDRRRFDLHFEQVREDGGLGIQFARDSGSGEDPVGGGDQCGGCVG